MIELRPWQPLARDLIIEHKRLALWMSVGSGKTLSTLLALDALLLAGETSRILVIAPVRVASKTWPDEIKKRMPWLSHTALCKVGGIPPKDREILARNGATIHCINYELVPWLVEFWGDDWPYDAVVSDECSRLKSMRGHFRTSKTGGTFYHAAGGMRARELGRIAHTGKVKRWINLTGTPASNGLADLWGSTFFLDRGARLGRTYTAFEWRWFRTGYDGYSKEPLDHAEKEIHERLSDVCFTIDLKDYVTIAEPQVHTLRVDMPAEAMKSYKQMERELFAEIEGHDIEAFNAAAKTQKCLQFADGTTYVAPPGKGPRPWTVVHDEKLERLRSLVEELGGNPLLLAYNHVSDRERILKEFPEARAIDNIAGEQAFREGKVKIGIAHPASLGHGVDGLQNHCHNVCFYGLDWNLENYDQFIGRVGPTRQMQAGHDRVVNVYRIAARGTLDEDVLERLASKCTVQDALLKARKIRNA